MSVGEIMGLVAGVFSTFSFLPQVIRIFKLKSAHEISMVYAMMMATGDILWLAYGIYDGLIPLIVWNALAITLLIALLYGKFKYGWKMKITAEASKESLREFLRTEEK